jgi:hypothetical protein
VPTCHGCLLRFLIDKTTNSLCDVSQIFLVFLRFYSIFYLTSKLEIKAAPRLRSTATPPHVHLMPALHSLMSGQGPHCLRLPEQPFHGTHEVLQRVWLASKVRLAPPFNCIQYHLACVDLDHCTSSTARAPTASGLYLERHHCRGCSNLVQFGASDAPQHDFILKISYFHFKIN